MRTYVYLLYLCIMERIEIERHRLIAKSCNELLRVCLDKDVDYLKKMIDNSKSIIDGFNSKNTTVIDVTNRENGSWESTLKKVVYGKYYNPIVKSLCHHDRGDDFARYKDAIKTEFKNACVSTVFSNDLRLNYILLNRKIINQYKVEPLLQAIKEVIHFEILKTFQEQNRKLISKYI